MVVQFLINLLFFGFIIALNSTGPTNSQYHISGYYGSRMLEQKLAYSYLNDKPSVIYWAYNYNVDKSGNLWMVKSSDHTVQYIKNSTGAIYKVMGKENTSGYREGYITNLLLNTPTSLCLFTPNSSVASAQSNVKPVFVDSSKDGCSNINKNNYTSCLLSNILDTDEVDPLNVSFLDFTSDELAASLKSSEVIKNATVYIADKGNHCIRSVGLGEELSTAIGGKCGTSGFLDGPLGTNLLNSPSLVGVDVEGNIFVMDSGNKYIRMIDTNKYMYTLYQGACFPTGRNIRTNSVNIPETICYKNWIKTSGEPTGHIYSQDSSSSSVCKQHYTLCSGYYHPLIRDN